MITLTSVNDAYTVSLSPVSCVINADFDGSVSSAQLSRAFTDVNVYLGDKQVKFSMIRSSISNTAIKYTTTLSSDGYTRRVSITELPTGLQTGDISFSIKTADGFKTTATFRFTVVRESTMLDWIQDWNGRTTLIKSSSIITPKAFFGQKDSSTNTLSGVYIGPDGLTGASSGIYAYLNCPESAFGESAGYEIFRLNKDGGMIGGWDINATGIFKQYTNSLSGAAGILEILSEGTLRYSSQDHSIWALNKDGSGLLASGNISWNSEGSAVFKGQLQASSGKIGGWTIGTSYLLNKHILIDSTSSYIGIHASTSSIDWDTDLSAAENHRKACIAYGGLVMFYESAASYGLTCYESQVNSIRQSESGIKTFQLGNTNFIAAWNFDSNALWMGTKNNVAKQYTESDTNSITIGTNGLRGENWYIDKDGSISFVGGLLQFDKSGGTIAGWNLYSTHFSTSRAALVSQDGYTGLFLSSSTSFPENASYTQFASHIATNGGIFLRTTAASSILSAYVKNKLTFFLNSNGLSQIAGWRFNGTGLFSGNSMSGSMQFAEDGAITISSEGIRGSKWRFEKDGSGALAGGHISWDKDGKVTFDENVTLSWKQLVDTGDVLTTTTSINADNIKTGTISAARINIDELLSNGNKWALKKNGSGYLASKNIEWDASGNLHLKGAFSQELKWLAESDASIEEVSSGAVSAFMLNEDTYLMHSSFGGTASSQSILNDVKIILPCDESYIGREVKLYQPDTDTFSRNGVWYMTITLITEDGSPIYGMSPTSLNDAAKMGAILWESISIGGGNIGLVCLPNLNDTIKSPVIWVVTNYNAMAAGGMSGGEKYEMGYAYTIFG